METGYKIIITWLIIWFILHALAFPGTRFAKWGTKKFKSYERFLYRIALIIVIPIIITIIYICYGLFN